MSVSPDLVWSIIRDNHCFLLKGINGQTYSKEPNNLRQRNSFRYNGLVRKKTVGVEAAKDGKGVVLVTRKPHALSRPGVTYTRVELKKGGRKTMGTIKATIRKNKYRKDLRMAACRRASALLQSQKPVAVRKQIHKKKN